MNQTNSKLKVQVEEEIELIKPHITNHKARTFIKQQECSLPDVDK